MFTRTLARTLFILFIVVAGTTSSLAVTSPVGATPGTFAISPTGAFTYTSPISVPPGTAGMEPKLSLVYNSQGGNGLLGIGWSLSGLSAVTRCPQTFAQDSVRGSVNFDANDRFCLDGQRLVAISGTDGADGTEYRTEIDSFSRVISYGATGNGPAWFKVWTKSGQVLEFGNSTDSSILAQGKATVAVWAVNKISDTVGNYLTVTYINNGNTNGEYYPTRIDYTSTTNASKTTICNSMTPCASVQFIYATRPDITPLYQAGSTIRNTVLVSDIKTYSGATLVRDYKLGYEQGVATNRSHLKTLSECAGDGVCLPATTFAWSDVSDVGTFGSTFSQVGVASATNGCAAVPADINGDGKSDFFLNCTVSSNGSSGYFVYAFLGNGDGTFADAGIVYLSTTSSCTAAPADINGDGKSDLFLNCSAGSNGSSGYAYLGNGDGTFTNAGIEYSSTSSCTAAPADINGDGKSDFFLNCAVGTGSTVSAYLENRDGTFTNAGIVYSSTTSSCRAVPADINGDGKSDFLLNCSPGSTGSSVYAYLSNGDGTFTNAGTASTFSGCTAVPADINGDGKSDFFLNCAVGTGSSYGYFVYAFLGNGNGAFTDSLPFLSDTSSCRAVPADINGDGKSDFFLVCGNSGNISSYISNGDGTFTSKGTVYSITPANTDLVPLDINGNGKSDFLVKTSGGSPVTFAYNAYQDSPSFADRLVKVTTGLFSTINLTYKSLTDTTVYNKGSGATYPSIDLQAPLYVISHVSSSNGVGGGTFDRDYTYGGAQAVLNGRGFKGFAWTKSVDDATGITVQTNYSQVFPYFGIPTQVTTTLNGVQLKKTTNSLSSLFSSAMSFYPYVNQSIETANDLNGAALPTVTTTSQYDAYGNPTNITVSTGDGYSKSTVNTYMNDTTRWFLGRLTRSAVTSTTP